MNWRLYLLLALLGLVSLTIVSAFQPSPGYMDADYYYAGGLQLVTGHGFTEPYLWNYLDDPAGLPHPSHAYWMPLASLLAALGAGIFRSASWLAARTGFLLVAAVIPPITSYIAWSISSRRDLALTAGLLAVFPAFYLPFLPVTDTFGIYMVLGGAFIMVLIRKPSQLNPLMLGLLAGLMHLSRADGLLWLLVALLAILVVFPKPPQHRARYFRHIHSVNFRRLLVGYDPLVYPQPRCLWHPPCSWRSEITLADLLRPDIWLSRQSNHIFSMVAIWNSSNGSSSPLGFWFKSF